MMRKNIKPAVSAKKSDKFIVEKDNTLLPFLFERFSAKSKTTVKSYLSHRQVRINNIITTQFNAILKAGDHVEVVYATVAAELNHPMMRIIFEDDDIIVVEKRSGLLSIGTDKIVSKTAYSILSEHVKKQDTNNKIFVVHRLDRETSGVMMFAKSQEAQKAIQSTWEDSVLERKYHAVVEGGFKVKSGEIATYLTESSAMKVYATTKEEGKIAKTSYNVIRENDRYSLLELQLKTGRKNQIRAHMEYVGHSIVGDKKYGSQVNPIGRVALHASTLKFIHPVTKEEMEFKTPLPAKFDSLF